VINWFGPRSWEAPICVDAPRCDVPVDTLCRRCARPIGPDDCGVTMPGSSGPVAFHLACQMKSVLPHTLWPRVGLVPEASDGLINGRFQCPSCGMSYSSAIGWMRRPPSELIQELRRRLDEDDA